MGNPIANLGDYNIARDLVKEAGGSWDTVYNNIGKTAVAKAAPKILFKGGFIGAGIIGLVWAGCETSRFMKDRKQLIENEPALKKQFAEAIEAESPMEDEDPTNNVELN